MRARWLAVACALAADFAAGVHVARAFPSCAREAGPVQSVVRVLDAETLLLDDGQEVRLIGALPPRPDTLGGGEEEWPPAQVARRALQALVEGRIVELRFDGRRRDRYGRLLAHVTVRAPDGPQWVQQSVIRSGHARAYALPGNAACLGALLEAEAAARAEHLGLWTQPMFAIRRAEETDALLRRTGSFVLVEGRVASVTHRQRETFVNFGRDWRRDFTASVPSRIVKETPGAAERLTALAGRLVRVRGWIERRNGPLITLGALDEIELLEEPAETPR